MDAFWLPGLAGVPTRTLRVGRAELTVPDLTPAHLEHLSTTLLENRRRHLAGRRTAEILAALEAVAARWRDPSYPLRRAAEEWLPAVTGYAPAMVAEGLRAQVERAAGPALRALLAAELPEGALDGFVPHPGGSGWTRAFGPELTGFVFSGNVPGIPAFHLATGLLIRSACLAKTATGEPLFAALWCRSLAEVDPGLGACVAAAWWPGEAADLHQAAFRRATAVVAFGSDPSLAALRPHLPPGCRFVAHGSRMSLGAIAREAMTPAGLPDLAGRAARDVAFYDQQGCVSPHAIFVEEGGERSPADFAAALAAALERLQGVWPRAALGPEDAADIQVARGEYRFVPGARIWTSPGSTAWSVVYLPQPGLEASTLGRFVFVHPVPDLAAIAGLAAPWAGVLQTCSYAGPPERGRALAAALAPLGLSRLCPVGRAQEPAPAWHHDGSPVLLPLLHWCDVEAPVQGAVREEDVPAPARGGPAGGDLKVLQSRHLLHSEHDFRMAREKGPVVIVRGEGSTVWDSDGRAYLDAQAGLCLVNVGYGRRELAEAARRQMEALPYYHTYWRFGNEPAVRLAARLAELAPPGLERVYFTPGGAEAVEVGIKLARAYHRARGEPGRHKILAFRNAYHGSTYGALSATGLAPHRDPFGPLVPGFVHVEPGDLAALEAALAAEGPETVAALVAEPIPAVGGVTVPPPDYWPRVRALLDRHGVLLVADEVLTGMGRCGTVWCLEGVYGVVPDILATAKGLTSGYLPLGATIVHRRIAGALEAADLPFLHGHTYSGHPVACAVALAAVDILLREDLPRRAAELGARLMDRLRAAGNPHFADVRGQGLLIGVALPWPDGTQFRVEEACFRRGVIIGVCPYTPVLMLTPPLTIREEEVDRLVAVVDEAVREVGAGAPR
ncbi:aminotransferase class III-fold pyridoxal phosphate-dependent enzyme [Caldinitratiruptor microaerophilus]|uniref:Uncharacterized protein n=1 Tax=Caldinitratiruptor microaerophilus TaxID=671077 RepID=A0AA35G9J9_9FIRM|nr:aminotransferase class III-fold pyridoxal phosphate-dependent enzyme [Caldinitratiruptor microaerophilus]BDG62166.1 hypothetical protein caldi_32560 [Caldinitratiruptor microaerophilus]